MSNRINGREDDFVAAGFRKLDQPLEDHPPIIQWGKIYLTKMTQEEKIRYLERLASAMNHAAAIIQEERDQLAVLATKKEEQIMKMTEALNQNNAMIQAEITKVNQERQSFNAEVKKLKDKIRKLERDGDNS
jgi:uncharacterized protein YlxW (UPF0749 family)